MNAHFSLFLMSCYKMQQAISEIVWVLCDFGRCALNFKWRLSLDDFLQCFCFFCCFYCVCEKWNVIRSLFFFFFSFSYRNMYRHNAQCARHMTCFNEQSLFSVYAQFSQYQNANRLHAGTARFHDDMHTLSIRIIQCQQFSFFETQPSRAHTHTLARHINKQKQHDWPRARFLFVCALFTEVELILSANHRTHWK